MKDLVILMAQINPTVGAIQANQTKIIQIIQDNQATHDLIIFPELALIGYPPEDLLFRATCATQVERALEDIRSSVTDAYVIIGHPTFIHEHCYNSVSVFHQQTCITRYHKQHLPNYGVFDEQRYFTPGPATPCHFEMGTHRFGLCVCEDIWRPGPVEALINHGIDTLIVVNASPFEYDKYQQRVFELNRYAIPILYVNQVGGQDELVFDGQSMAMHTNGDIHVRSPAFTEALTSITLNRHGFQGDCAPLLDEEALIYQALICGLRDYVEKNQFKGVLLGLSGGIDSALTLAIAVDALGPDRVHAVMMPSPYTATMSREDALAELHALAVTHHTTLPIDSTFQALTTTLSLNNTVNITAQNLQARIRGTLLMALSNETGDLLLTTSNKSETAVGYTTLYGDMCGGFAVLKDVLKTRVYQLAHYRNTLSPVIPERVLTRPPTAELAPNQTDQDSLPDYATLDAILEHYMENNQDKAQLIQMGYDPTVVTHVIQLVKRNEYKRRQSAPGIKLSHRAFGKEWRYPITSGWIDS